MANRARKKKATASKTKVVKKKVYTEDGLFFKTKSHLVFYGFLKELKGKGFIKSFTVPTLNAGPSLQGEDNETAMTDIKNKYRAVKCEVDGHIFDSLMEARYYLYLKKEKQDGKIKDYQLQPKYLLQESFKKDGKTIRKIEYIADFLVLNNDSTHIVYDVKGMITKDFSIKKKMFDFKYRDLPLKCIRYVEKEDSWVDALAKKSKPKGA